ncbi:MAG: helix-turn-helix transcriptional regulator [Bacteriovoracaceae bacterium]|nr:helix-turn-helix transcriptional regulator [Bacteriovoracaceae bacterium]
MQPATQKEKMNLSHAKALRRAREMMKVTRIEMARRLNLSIEAIKKYEKGGSIIDERKIHNYLQALHLTDEDYQKIKRGKGIGINKKQRIVFSNSDRRSYKRMITKEVRVLKILRQMKNLSQDQASFICGYSRPSIGHIENGRITLDQTRIKFIVESYYSRPSIGHIENGRITLDQTRIKFIVESYGQNMSEFNRLMCEEILRDEILKSANEKMKNLSEEKLKIVNSLLLNL